MLKLSVVIITYNEERRIENTLKSVADFANEIIVVDSFSTDKTKEICLKYNAKFTENPFEGHIEQKNFALNLATNEYVLSLDADEVISSDLKNSILNVLKNGFEKDGYFFNRKTHYVDQFINHCGWYPDSKLRLLKKNSGIWGGVNPHDIIEMKEGSSVGFIKGDLLHYSYLSISDHISQTNKFTTIAAKASFQMGKRSNLFKAISRPPWQFFRDYIIKGGILDGRYGLIVCLINSLSTFLKYIKISELSKNREI